jgi:hypothetical protein
MRSLIVVLMMCASALPATAQDYSVEFRQVVRRAENQFSAIWRSKLSMAKENHEEISKLLGEISPVAKKIGVDPATCFSTEENGGLANLIPRLKETFENYLKDYKDESENYKNLETELNDASDERSSIMTYRVYAASYLRTTMYHIVLDVINEDATAIQELAKLECINAKILSMRQFSAENSLAKSMNPSIAIRESFFETQIELFEMTDKYIISYHL